MNEILATPELPTPGAEEAEGAREHACELGEAVSPRRMATPWK